jgi:hypothetical protein
LVCVLNLDMLTRPEIFSPSITNNYLSQIIGSAIIVESIAATTPLGEWFGSVADEGRAKLRYAWGRRMEPLIP